MQYPIVFFGSSPFSVIVLQKLLDSKRYTLDAVITTPDKPAERGLKLTPNPVKVLAQQHSLPIFTDIKDFLASTLPQDSVGLIAAYGRIVGPKTLSKLNDHIYGIHPSLLPKYRGPSPLQKQILDGVSDSGVTVFKIDLSEDTGPIVATHKAVIQDTDTWITLGNRLFSLGTDLFLSLDPEHLSLTPQIESEATYTKKLTRQSGFIPWEKFKSTLDSNPTLLDRRHRALQGWPGVWSLNPQKKRVKLVALAPPTVVVEGGSPVLWEQ